MKYLLIPLHFGISWNYNARCMSICDESLYFLLLLFLFCFVLCFFFVFFAIFFTFEIAHRNAERKNFGFWWTNKCPCLSLRRTIRSETFFCKWKPFKNEKKMFFISPQLNVLQIFKFLSSSFGHVEKSARLER